MYLPEGLTEQDVVGFCARAFPDRHNRRIGAMKRLSSRQHEVVAFRLRWNTASGDYDESLIARRYISTLSWWRPDDLGKAQREASVSSWLYKQGFPTPEVYLREFSPIGDVVLFSRIPGEDWAASGLPFRDVVRPHVDQFAKLLASLHSIQPTQDILNVIPRVTLISALANLTALAIQIGEPTLRQAVDRAMTHAYQVDEADPVLLHGDYHFSNVLIFDGQISGIIDWEYAALGDPRWDVANAYSQLVDFDAASAADDFLAAYLRYSNRVFSGPPVFMMVAPLQQWTISEWLVKEQAAGRFPTHALGQDLIELRDVHRHRAQAALQKIGE